MAAKIQRCALEGCSRAVDAPQSDGGARVLNPHLDDVDNRVWGALVFCSLDHRMRAMSAT